MLGDWLNGVPVVLEVLPVYLKMTALVLESAWGGTFETHHNHLRGGHIIATVAHSLDIFGSRCWLVANCVLCWMESAVETAEPLEMAAVKVGNNRNMADDTELHVSWIHSCLQGQFIKYFPMIQICLNGIVPCQIGFPEKPYSLSLVEIESLTCSVNQVGSKLL